MVQPIEGLVVSVPVLIEAQCMQRLAPEVQTKLVSLCPPTRETPAGAEGHAIRDLGAFFAELLGLTPDLFDAGSSVPEELSLYVAEGRQTLRPTLGLRKMEAEPPPADGDEAADTTPASRAGAKYAALVWDTAAVVAEAAASGHSPAGAPAVLDLDKPETATGPWDYPPAAKFDRLLRHCRVPVGILTNREVVRLVYAPHGESSGHITFRIEDMVTVGGRPILDAFVMLLSATRFFGVAKEHALPALLAESRKRQANVTNELAEQVFHALGILLAGFEAAAERDGRTLLDDALAREGDHIYKGLLTVLLRLVFVLYAEDRGLLPTDHSFYAENLSVLGLFERLQEDAGAHPDSMSRRFGAWGQLVGLFRAVYLGVEHGDLHMPPRRGALFDPNTYPFLEGWGPSGGAPIVMPEHRAEVRVPTVDDGTVHQLLEKLVIFEGQRLSYRTLDVEQIGSVYEALMGYHVTRVPAPAVCMKPDGIWLTAREVLDVPAARRAKWLKEEIGISKAQADALAEKLAGAKDEHAALDELGEYAKGSRKADKALARAKVGQLVLQPGAERRRTSSHYTPRSLSAPIVRRTLEPLLACMGPEPPSERILHLKICDPAMGSGAFLVEACRFLGDHLVAAWTREGKLEEVAGAHEDPVLHARRMVAQRCLYGVDKNDAAVELAKLSLWLVTLAKDLPFTFLDHALRHGDSLVGLSFDQIKAFHWKPDKQVQLAEQVLKDALDEAISIRQQILELANDGSPEAQREKERLLDDAEDASDRARLLGDVVVGAFFAHDKDKDREKERQRRLTIVQRWLAGDADAETELRQMQAEIRGRLPVFHWMLEFPEVFYAERPDPLDEARVNRAAYMDGFVGNPPFMGKNAISASQGEVYIRWLQAIHEAAHGASDITAHFFRRCATLLGSHGTLGLIATNTIAQGDTRATGLQPLLGAGCEIYEAVRSMLWPGEASVAVAVVHLARGHARQAVGRATLDGARVEKIDSRLRAGRERPDARRLIASDGLWFSGSKVYGEGFVLTPAERELLLASDQRNGEHIFPFLGGEEVNSKPDQGFDRYVVSLGQLALRESSGWPDLLQLVEERVRPERERARSNTADGAHRRKYWWQHAQPRPELYAAIAPLQRCLVCAMVSKHLMFSFQPTNRIFSHKLYVFPFETNSPFAVLQSRCHAAWTWLLSSTLEERLNYSASDCFDTFPFPQPDPHAAIPALEEIGQRLYDARAKYMLETQQGLTQTYNKLKDPACHDAHIIELRRLHEEMDRAVLDAYTWTDIEVPPYCPATPAEHKALEHFQNEVIDRLFVLNARRAEDERRLGLGDGKKGKPKGRVKKGATGTASENQRKLDLE
ncbi:MAG: N-6 DNA methylase [Myxococcales bacterium]|nr:N-6 DNA methylase [Myxococcales bacterium]